MQTYTMLTAYFYILLLFGCVNSNSTQQQNNSASSGENFQVEILAENLEVPWGMDFLPDGRLIFNERPGYINILDLQTKQVKRILTRDIRDRAEGGLLGLAVDPDFNNSKYIFIYETIETGNRIVRLKLENDILTEDKILIDKIPHAMFHDGGILRFGPDGYLYAGTGDARDPNSAQDLKSYAGKILRMDKNGNAPTDNPFENLIYSYGHRNVQGLCWDNNKNMYASEHGPSGELNGWCCNDEINTIYKGQNYGWPYVIGDDKKENTILPKEHSGKDTWAPGGIVYVDDFNEKEKNIGSLVTACLRDEKLLQIYISIGDATISKQSTETLSDKQPLVTIIDKHEIELLEGDYGRLRNIITASDGSLIFCSSNKDGRGSPDKSDDKIYRMKMK
ncbi:MAG: PQQ-dependent sugar dehydrogenase [Fimbriimonadaceae bacterium]|nr:PQQ-dependent sugar dehydrogenase [Chitinophagales bacterium]